MDLDLEKLLPPQTRAIVIPNQHQYTTKSRAKTLVQCFRAKDYYDTCLYCILFSAPDHWI